ncbi:MAG: putative quinol monooxygenase [Bryobacteraceae bacterium]
MKDGVVSVVAEMVAKPGKEEELRAELLKMLQATRKEAGCIQYDLHAHIDQPGRFVFYENWATVEALERHSKSDHIQAFRAIRGNLLQEDARVEKYTRIA